MAALTPKIPTLAGVNPAPAAATGTGDTAANPRGNLVLLVTNGDADPMTVGIVAQQTTRPADGVFPAQVVDDIEVTIPAGESRLIGPIPAAYTDENGNVEIAYTDETSVTVVAIQLPA